MNCKCAPACRLGLDEATQHWPDRNRASDGCCGDAAHAARQSDHNPDASGYAHAFDLTHDPLHGVDCHLLSRAVMDDSRVTYIIWNGFIYKRYKAELGWQPYTGANAHRHHMHVSIKPDATFDLSPWPWSTAPPEAPPSVPPVTLRFNLQGYVKEIKELQNVLALLGIYTGRVDGKFGTGTEGAVREFQKSHGLTPDGWVGPLTRAMFNKVLQERG